MRLNQFLYLTKIEEYHSISKAASALFTSQPSISLAIQELETELDLQILIRTSKGVHFTPEGLLVLNEAKKIISALDNISSIQKISLENISCSLTFGVDCQFSSLLISDIALQLKQRYPNFSIHVQTQTTLQTIKAVAEHTQDMALIHYNDFDGLKIQSELSRFNLQAIDIFYDELCFATHPNHPLCSQKQLCLKDIFSYPWLIDSDTKNIYVQNFFNKLPAFQTAQVSRIHIEDIGTQRRYITQSNSVQLLSRLGAVYGNKVFQYPLQPLNIADFCCNNRIICITTSSTFTAAEQLILSELRNYVIED